VLLACYLGAAGSADLSSMVVRVVSLSGLAAMAMF
jgi:hypothetical protein